MGRPRERRPQPASMHHRAWTLVFARAYQLATWSAHWDHGEEEWPIAAHDNNGSIHICCHTKCRVEYAASHPTPLRGTGVHRNNRRTNSPCANHNQHMAERAGAMELLEVSQVHASLWPSYSSRQTAGMTRMVLKERMRNREGTDYELFARGVTDQHRQCSYVT